MPILIRELVIKARVDTETARPAPAPRDTGDGGSAGAITAEDLTRILADQRER